MRGCAIERSNVKRPFRRSLKLRPKQSFNQFDATSASGEFLPFGASGPDVCCWDIAEITFLIRLASVSRCEPPRSYWLVFGITQPPRCMC